MFTIVDYEVLKPKDGIRRIPLWQMQVPLALLNASPLTRIVFAAVQRHHSKSLDPLVLNVLTMFQAILGRGISQAWAGSRMEA